ncbi:hypothetical protein D3C87_1360640 [compost metagenome]
MLTQLFNRIYRIVFIKLNYHWGSFQISNVLTTAQCSGELQVLGEVFLLAGLFEVNLCIKLERLTQQLINALWQEDFIRFDDLRSNSHLVQHVVLGKRPALGLTCLIQVHNSQWSWASDDHSLSWNIELTTCVETQRERLRLFAVFLRHIYNDVGEVNCQDNALFWFLRPALQANSLLSILINTIFEIGVGELSHFSFFLFFSTGEGNFSVWLLLNAEVDNRCDIPWNSFALLQACCFYPVTVNSFEVDSGLGTTAIRTCIYYFKCHTYTFSFAFLIDLLVFLACLFLDSELTSTDGAPHHYLAFRGLLSGRVSCTHTLTIKFVLKCVCCRWVVNEVAH